MTQQICENSPQISAVAVKISDHRISGAENGVVNTKPACSYGIVDAHAISWPQNKNILAESFESAVASFSASHSALVSRIRQHSGIDSTNRI